MLSIILIFSVIFSLVSGASPPGDVVGKITVGYQGWFAAKGDGSAINDWWHWTRNSANPPDPNNVAVISWPDMREYTTQFQTGFANLGNGQNSTLFSSFSDQTIDTQFKWMAQYKIDVAALQRFNPTGGEGPIRDQMAEKVRINAEKYGVKFYIMYDVSDWTNFATEMPADWTNKMSKYINSPAYARQNGKPVICIWGFGFNDHQRPFPPDMCLNTLNWFKNQSLYVIGGVPTHWRTGDQDSRPNFTDVYNTFDMISPWMVGRIRTVADEDNIFKNVNTPDLAYLSARGIDYQPCIIPGNLTEHDRAHGELMWRQIYNMKSIGVQGLYISMFDEYNEGNQIAKTAENSKMTPSNYNFVTLDEDGTICSSDYYLRLATDGGNMFKGLTPLTPTRPTLPTCPLHYTLSSINNRTCYSFVNSTADWNTANAQCKALASAGTLTSIDSGFANSVVLGYVNRCSNAYIGLQNVNNNWVWVNGDVSPYRNWKSGYPTNDPNLACAVINKSDGTWTNQNCATPTCSVCQTIA